MHRRKAGEKQKERRRDRRRLMSLEVVLGGYEVLLTDLSMVGFGAAIDATDRRPYDFRAGQQLRLEIRFGDGDTLSLPVEIIRPVGENGVLGGVFLGLSDTDYKAVESLVTGRFQRRR